MTEENRNEATERVGTLAAAPAPVAEQGTPEQPELLPSIAEQNEQDERAAGAARSEGAEDDELSYLAAGVDPADVASFFAAMAELHRAGVCSIVRDGTPPLGVSIEALGITSGVVQVMGALVGLPAFLIFERAEDHNAFRDAGEALERDEDAVLPPHRLLQLDGAVDVSSRLHDEIAEHGWELASPDAIPVLLPVEAGIVHPPALRDLRVAEALARALTRALPGVGDALEVAWAGGAPWAHRCTVPTRAGDVEVELRASHHRVAGRDESEPDDDITDEMAKDRELARAFARSPEAQALAAWGYLPILQDLARRQIGSSLDSFDPSDLDELLYDAIPRKLRIPPTKAGPLIEELRAFYAYLARTRGATAIDAAVRSADVVPKLEAALAEGRGARLAESHVTAAAGLGNHPPPELGALIEAMPTELESPAPHRAPQRPQASKAAKAKRKAARKARKKNR